MLEFLIRIDSKLLLFLNGKHSVFMDKIMWFISGKEEWIPLYAVLLGWIIYKFRWKSIPIVIFIAILITLSDQLSVRIFKDTINRLRPCHNPDIRPYIHLVNNYCGGRYGFISNHASNSFAFAAFISFLFGNKKFSFFIFIWAVLVSYSRIYLGVHYPGDMLAGAIFGILLATLIKYCYVKTDEKLLVKMNL